MIRRALMIVMLGCLLCLSWIAGSPRQQTASAADIREVLGLDPAPQPAACIPLGGKCKNSPSCCGNKVVCDPKTAVCRRR